VVYVANLWPWKGHDVLLRALAMLPATLPLHALLVGDGVERERLEKRAAALGIAHRVRFAGYVADPWAAAAGSWAYVHPTLRDAMPSAVLEAMMSGLPVVASATGGVPEVVRDGETGVLVPPGDAAALARALRDLAADRVRRDRLASAARAYALAELRADRSLDELFELYDDLLS
jgi:glycosyltransferase involved in cell wall biosynthesis